MIRLDRGVIAKYLVETDPAELKRLFAEADSVRRRYAGDEVHLRGLIEFSNYCSQNCLYCGLRRSNRAIKRYRMTLGEIYETARQAAELGLKTVVLQSGEDRGYSLKQLCELVARIKDLGMAVTLSIGELTFGQYKRLKKAGADRYLLRFETSDPDLYSFLRPGKKLSSRIRCLGHLKKLGFEVGSGVMVGLPGQTPGSLADDICAFKALDLDMIGIGPFIPHPHTPLAKAQGGTLGAVLRVLALTRLATKDTNIPATTAVGTVDSKGRMKALLCGANVLMPNMTPEKFRKYYEIYPDKISLSDDAVKSRASFFRMIRSLGRTVGSGAGFRRRKK